MWSYHQYPETSKMDAGARALCIYVSFLYRLWVNIHFCAPFLVRKNPDTLLRPSMATRKQPLGIWSPRNRPFIQQLAFACDPKSLLTGLFRSRDTICQSINSGFACTMWQVSFRRLSNSKLLPLWPLFLL